MNDLRDRVARLEDFVSPPQTDGAVSLSVQTGRQAEEIGTLNASHEALKQEMETRFVDLMAELVTFVDSAKAKHDDLEKLVLDVVGDVQTVKDETTLIKRAMNSPSEAGSSSKIKVPEPKSFNGSRNAKELENFLWDMEREKVTMTSMYLAGDAKLWWRTRLADDKEAGRPTID